MRNRAKCKLCESIIESFHQYDYVSCKCGEIAVDGGNNHLRAVARDYRNFLRVDDEGNEIIVKVVENEAEAAKQQDNVKDDYPSKPNRQELLDELQLMIKAIENLPTHAMSLPITHYDFCSGLMLLSAILRAEI